MKKYIGILGIICLSASAGYSSDGNEKQSKPTQQVITFAEFQEACMTPTKFHNQTAPNNVQLSCRDVQYKWVDDPEGTISLKGSRQITSALISDKYSVVPLTEVVEVAPQKTSCHRFKEVMEVMEPVRTLTCADLTAFKGSATEFCGTSIAAMKVANPSAVKSEATGKTAHLCGLTYLGTTKEID